VSGKVATDVVSIAGLTVKNQEFGSVNNESYEFYKQPNDGLIGMAFGTTAQSRQPTFFENLIKERKIAAPLFSVHLSRHEERGSSVRSRVVKLWLFYSILINYNTRCALAVSTTTGPWVP
jgi:hypothetical protein